MPKRSYAKPPQRRIVRRDPEKPDWEGKGCLIISMRDLSLKEDADVWAKMAKVTFQVHNPVDNVILRQEGAVELTDVSTMRRQRHWVLNRGRFLPGEEGIACNGPESTGGGPLGWDLSQGRLSPGEEGT